MIVITTNNSIKVNPDRLGEEKSEDMSRKVAYYYYGLFKQNDEGVVASKVAQTVKVAFAAPGVYEY